MPSITTNSPPDPAVLKALLEIQKSVHDTEIATDHLLEPLERLITATEEITKR